jgi:hypothetical protein
MKELSCQAHSLLPNFCRQRSLQLAEEEALDPVYVIYKSSGQMDASAVACLAYAAFHCSSLLAFAISMSFEETKREPTVPVEMDGIESSIVFKVRVRI